MQPVLPSSDSYFPKVPAFFVEVQDANAGWSNGIWSQEVKR